MDRPAPFERTAQCPADPGGAAPLRARPQKAIRGKRRSLGERYPPASRGPGATLGRVGRPQEALMVGSARRADRGRRSGGIPKAPLTPTLIGNPKLFSG